MSRLEAIKAVEVDDGEALRLRNAAAAQQQAAFEQQKAALTKMLMVLLQTLGQRFVVALANLFTLLTAASAFFLWYLALPTLDALKIVGLSIYSLFVLALQYGRRK